MPGCCGRGHLSETLLSSCVNVRKDADGEFSRELVRGALCRMRTTFGYSAV